MQYVVFQGRSLDLWRLDFKGLGFEEEVALCPSIKHLYLCAACVPALPEDFSTPPPPPPPRHVRVTCEHRGLLETFHLQPECGFWLLIWC